MSQSTHTRMAFKSVSHFSELVSEIVKKSQTKMMIEPFCQDLNRLQSALHQSKEVSFESVRRPQLPKRSLDNAFQVDQNFSAQLPIQSNPSLSVATASSRPASAKSQEGRFSVEQIERAKSLLRDKSIEVCSGCLDVQMKIGYNGKKVFVSGHNQKCCPILGSNLVKEDAKEKDALRKQISREQDRAR
ncbi:hypothetical protein MIR68_011810 [Amoeboaphelidium protococcarum]|nr:hypothetical protein MIR68_011810 [Amoeboaphelidium protococcarum]